MSVPGERSRGQEGSLAPPGGSSLPSTGWQTGPQSPQGWSPATLPAGAGPVVGIGSCRGSTAPHVPRYSVGTPGTSSPILGCCCCCPPGESVPKPAVRATGIPAGPHRGEGNKPSPAAARAGSGPQLRAAPAGHRSQQQGETGAHGPGTASSAPVHTCFLPLLPGFPHPGTPRLPRLSPAGRREPGGRSGTLSSARSLRRGAAAATGAAPAHPSCRPERHPEPGRAPWSRDREWDRDGGGSFVAPSRGQRGYGPAPSSVSPSGGRGAAAQPLPQGHRRHGDTFPSPLYSSRCTF